MKLLLLSIISHLFISNSYAISPSDLFGCFETIEINNRDLSYAPDYERSLSMFEDFSSSRTYRNVDNNRVEPINVFTFFHGIRQGEYYSYVPIVFFQDLGNYEISDNSLSYVVDEDVFLLNTSTYMYRKVDHRMSFNIEKAGEFYVGSVKLISYIRGIDRDFSFKLKKVSCPTSY